MTNSINSTSDVHQSRIRKPNKNRYFVKRIDRNDTDLLSQFADLYNQSGQLTWQLSPSRVVQKLGRMGEAYGLFVDVDKHAVRLVGTVAVKASDIAQYDVGEIGYLWIEPEHRTFRNVSALYSAVKKVSKKFDIVYNSTNVKNEGINKLLSYAKGMTKIFTAKSQYSTNRLHYWLSSNNNGDIPARDQISILKDQFKPDDDSINEGLGRVARYQTRVAADLAVLKIKAKIEKLQYGFNREKDESREMFRIFLQKLKSALGNNKNPTDKELKVALHQLRDVSKVAYLIPMMVVPMGVTLGRLIEKLANNYGYSILPDAFGHDEEEMVRYKNRQMVKIKESQTFSSAATSIKGKEVAALKGLIKRGLIETTDTVLDYGAGKYGRNAEYLRDNNIRCFAADKFNGHDADGWLGVAKTVPSNLKFDVGFSSYVLNVVPPEVERDIVMEMERKCGDIYHITRGNDITDTVWYNFSGKSKNKWIMEWVEKNYPHIHEKIQDGSVTKVDAKEVASGGVRTAEDSYQRIPDLSKMGYKILAKSNGTVVWGKK